MIIELIRDVVVEASRKTGNNVNFVFGDSSYIREQIRVLKACPDTAVSRFPLIGLYVPVEEMKDSDDYYCKADVSLIIAVNTSRDYTNEQRLEISFKGILRPLYEAFISSVKECGKFDFGYGNPVHSYTENYSFGRRGSFDVDGKELDEKIDAIEIKNLELTVKNQNCYANRY